MKKRVTVFLLPLILLCLFSLLACGDEIDNTTSQSLTLYFCLNNGEPIESMRFDGIEDIVLPTEIKKEGHELEGWYVDEELLTPFKVSTATDGMTLYAKWILIRLAITFHYYDQITKLEYVDFGQRLEVLPHDTKRDGFVFWGWYEDEDFGVPFDNSTPITNSMQIYGKWVKIDVPTVFHEVFVIDWDGTELFSTVVEEGSHLGDEQLTQIEALPATKIEEFVGFFINGQQISPSSHAFVEKTTLTIGYSHSISDASLFEFVQEASGYYVSASGSLEGDVFLPPFFEGVPVVGTLAAGKKEDGAFFESGMQSVFLPSTFVSIGAYSFYNSSLKAAVLKEGISSIGDAAFFGCQELGSIQIPNSVVAIGKNAFNTCSKLQSVTITQDSSLEQIQDFAFGDCVALTDFYIPSRARIVSDTDAEARIFTRCNSLLSVRTNAQNPYYYAIDGVLYSKDRQTLICYPAGKKDSVYMLEESITSIKSYALYGNKFCKEFILPNGLTTIGTFAFSGCAIQKITIPSSVQAIQTSAFWYCQSLEKVEFESDSRLIMLAEFSFYLCGNLTSFTITAAIPPTFDGYECNAFSSEMNVNIYVPQQYITAYKEVWTLYKNNIFPL